MASVRKRGNRFHAKIRRSELPHASAAFPTREEAEQWALEMDRMADAIATERQNKVFVLAETIMQGTGRTLPDVLQEALTDLCKKLGMNPDAGTKPVDKASGQAAIKPVTAVKAQTKAPGNCSSRKASLELDNLDDDQLNNWFQMVMYDLFSMQGVEDEIDFSSKAEQDLFSKTLSCFVMLLESSCAASGRTVAEFSSDKTTSFPVFSIEEVAESEGLSVEEFAGRVGDDYPFPACVLDGSPAYSLLQFAAIKAGAGQFMAENLCVFSWNQRLADLLRDAMEKRSTNLYRKALDEYQFNLSGGQAASHLDWLDGSKLFWLNEGKVEPFPSDLFRQINSGEPVLDFAGRNILSFEMIELDEPKGEREITLTPIPINTKGLFCYRLLESGNWLEAQIPSGASKPLISHQDVWSGSLQAKEFLAWISDNDSVVDRILAAMKTRRSK